MKKIYILSVLITLNTCVTSVTSAQSADSLIFNPDIEHLHSFMDSVIATSMDSLNVPGVLTVIMNRDSILYSKGNGYANIEEERPVTSESTIWRLASISKVVTATAVMQLVEKGELDLDTNINSYLENLTIPEDEFGPVTLRHLLTHTPGFDDRYLNKSFRTEEEWPDLNTFLNNILPKRIFPPGEIYSYSNVGNALAALVVEDVTGLDFDIYCRQNIFTPLQMNQTSFRILSDRMAENLYTGYVFENDTFTSTPFDYLGDYPAGQLLSTGEEFARFMMSHLNGGEYDGAQILSPQTVKEMHSPQFKQHPKLSGAVGYAFHITEERGNKVVRHGGGYMGLSTRMWLLPDEGAGLFIAANVSASPIIDKISYAFLDNYFDNDTTETADYPLTDLPEYDPYVSQYTGYYRTTRHTHHDFTKIFLLAGFMNDLEIRENEEGMLVMPDFYGNDRRLIQVEPGLFQSIDDDYYMSFKLEENGVPVYLFTHGTGALEKVNLFYSTPVQSSIFMGLGGIFLIILVIGFIHMILPDTWKKSSDRSVSNGKLRKFTTGTAFLFIFHWVSMGLVLFILNPSYELTMTGLAYGMPATMYAVQLLPVLGVFAVLGVLYNFLKQFGKPEMQAWRKFTYSIVIFLFLLYIWILSYWNILGFNFG
jgi:CubicO group peptidase (beta-lactamase class C family)